MQARVRKVALPAPKLPPTHEYMESPKLPESWEAQRAAKKRIAEEKRRRHTRKGFHAWTDAERKELIEAREAGKSWTEIADVAQKEGGTMTVRCIYGGTVQESSEKAGMKGWCDKHCKTLGMERGHICYAALKKAGINPEEEHKK